jgi:flagellar FliL protein
MPVNEPGVAGRSRTDAMADAKKGENGGKKKGILMPLLIGLVAAIVSGGAGFMMVNMDMLPLPEKEPEAAHAAPAEPIDLPHTAFLPLTPLIVTLGSGDDLRQLQLTAQLEVAPEAVDAVSLLTPRVVDVLNTYLRAVDSEVVENPAAMLRMRAQMLRRIQVVTGQGMVRDLLVAEFILR